MDRDALLIRLFPISKIRTDQGLASRDKRRRQFWNAIPEWEKERVVEVARKYPEKSCREIAWHITDEMSYFISESSVYRILKAKNLVTSPVYTVISAKDKFEHPTTKINELCQTTPYMF